MKRILAFIGIALVLCIVLLYISLSSTSKTFTTCTLANRADIDTTNFKNHDSVLLSASLLYDGNFLKEMMQGDNYRSAWAEPIMVPIVFLDTLYGGLRVIEEGGGKQTHSLELEGPKGIRYTLRSISKDPEKLIPEFARTLGLENIVVDGISSQHPFAATVVASMAEEIGLLHTHPRIVFVPKQTVLGDNYNSKYGNRLYLLEYESEGEVNWTHRDHVIEIMDTEDLQQLKLEFPERVSIDQRALVKARLFDIVIGDWDRHAKQWGWVVQETGTGYLASPLACDRDNAFFKLDGLIPNIVSNKNVLPGLQSFEKDIDYLPGLVMPFDVYFLSGVGKKIFIEEAKELQTSLTDEVIDEAFMTWPAQIHALDATEISNKIKERRDNLMEYAVGFKKILDEKPKLTKPLKGSEDLDLSQDFLACFDCEPEDE